MFPLFSDLVAKQIQVYNNELCTVQKESNGFFFIPADESAHLFFLWSETVSCFHNVS